jgi:hydroxymethylpyrimidine pyrophosphatase-like HAD family hydrolase
MIRYKVLACDFDGTLATHDRVSEETIAALRRVIDSGRKLVLVTGRILDDLLAVFPDIGIFDRVVAEDGAVIFNPESGEELVLADPPPEALIRDLKAREVRPISVGSVILATWHPHEQATMEAIRDNGFEHQIIFNKGAVMIVPPGINKATGLRTALHELGLSTRNTVGVGDAENDHAFLHACEFAVAVNNALPMLKHGADWVTAGDAGRGVVELADRLLPDDLRKYAAGDLGIARSFYFRGPENRLNTRAKNLLSFTHLARTIDEDTWMFHLRRGDYSRWIRDIINDNACAAAVARTESAPDISPTDSRQRVVETIESRYAMPA